MYDSLVRYKEQESSSMLSHETAKQTAQSALETACLQESHTYAIKDPTIRIDVQGGGQFTSSVRPGFDGGANMGRANPQSLGVNVTREAQPYLGDPNFKRMLDRIIAIITNEANQLGVKVDRVELSIKRSHEARWSELVLRILVALNLRQSLAFWESVGLAIQQWSHRLNEHHRHILADELAIFVEPLEPYAI